MIPDNLTFGQPFDARGDDELLRQLCQHKAAGHTADVSQRVETQQRGGQNQVINGIPEHLAVPCQQRIHGHQPGTTRHDAVQPQIHTPGAAHPAEPGVKHQQPHHPHPENRRGITGEADNAHHVVGNTVTPRRRQHAQRNAEARADDNRHRRQLHGRREDADNIVGHRFPGQQRVTEVAVQQVDEVNAKLGHQRLVKAQLVIDLLIGALVGIRADNRQHRVDGHHAANEKGQQQQAKQRNRHLHQPF